VADAVARGPRLLRPAPVARVARGPWLLVRPAAAERIRRLWGGEVAGRGGVLRPPRRVHPGGDRRPPAARRRGRDGPARPSARTDGIIPPWAGSSRWSSRAFGCTCSRIATS